MSHRHSLIVAGGAGTRLWPLSRLALPKQLLRIVADDDGERRSLLELADRRLGGVVDPQRRYICAAEGHRRSIVDAIRAIDDDRFLGEPMGRDTVNAIGLGAAILHRRDPDAVLAVLTADHLIEPQEAFAAAIDAGFRTVEADPDRLVTFAVTATFPATGYGWVKPGAPLPGTMASSADGFIEKPALDVAQRLLAEGWGWNSGMFVFSAAGFLRRLAQHVPVSHAGLMRIADAWETPKRRETLDAVYPTLTKISVDYGVMQPAAKETPQPVCVVPMDVRWRDVGSWPSLGETLAADKDGNRSLGSALFHESRRSLAVTDGSDHLITLVGVEDIIVVHTADATLVCRADLAEKVRDVAAQVPERLR